ncbi:MAG: hypothetical protein GY799_28300, partial [Desulfobulbaceae bacterium]|nr:hypothetical protein [Desulfobulbaceae bacterium]
PFDPSFPILLQTDASDYGIRAELLLLKNGKECPVTFAARTLSPVERNYSTPEKEALAAVWAIDKKFPKYLLGHHFVIESDQSSLTVLLYHFSTRALQQTGLRNFGNTTSNPNISLGQRIRSLMLNKVDDSKVIFCLITGIPISDFIKSTANDPDLQTVIGFCLHGWPAKASIPPQLHSYFKQRLSLSVEGGLLLKGTCLCVPLELHKRTPPASQTSWNLQGRNWSRVTKDLWHHKQLLHREVRS